MSPSLTLFRAAQIFAKKCSARSFHTPSARTKACEPLSILFCGSDDFSIASLRALNTERVNRTSASIASIDVVCRPGKRTGRGLKNVTHPPIRAVVQELGLPLHEIDTFTKWHPPNNINLIIAVSFGLLVPPRILGAAKYGGLNVHPSMLPDLRGAAPLQHTLLQRRTHTGVSIQTLHPTKFDHGVVLAQTPFPGIRISGGCSPKDLELLLAPVGAELLVQAIQRRLFLAPLQAVGLSEQQIDELTDGKGVAHAPKITAEDRRLDWDAMPSASDILLRSQVLGRLWDDTTYAKATGTDIKKRITYGVWLPTGIVGPSLSVQLGQGRAITSPYDLEGKDGGRARPELILKEGTSADAVSGLGTISAPCFTIEGGRKDEGGKELVRDMLRYRKDTPFHKV